MITGKKQEPAPCDLCGRIFSNRDVMRKHVRVVHCNDKSHVCDHCGKGFPKKYLLKTHVQQLHMRQSCEHCGKSVLNAHFLKLHMVFDHGIKDGVYICDICPKKCFSSETAFKKHMYGKHDRPK